MQGASTAGWAPLLLPGVANATLISLKPGSPDNPESSNPSCEANR